MGYEIVRVGRRFALMAPSCAIVAIRDTFKQIKLEQLKRSTSMSVITASSARELKHKIKEVEAERVHRLVKLGGVWYAYL